MGERLSRLGGIEEGEPLQFLERDVNRSFDPRARGLPAVAVPAHPNGWHMPHALGARLPTAPRRHSTSVPPAITQVVGDQSLTSVSPSSLLDGESAARTGTDLTTGAARVEWTQDRASSRHQGRDLGDGAEPV